MVLRPGFEPGSVTREATILDRTILPELGILRVGYHEQLWFNKNSDSEETLRCQQKRNWIQSLLMVIPEQS